MSDKIQFPCPFCSTQLAVSSVYAGKQAKCPGCGSVVDVPRLSAPLGSLEPNSEEWNSRNEMGQTAPYLSPLSKPVGDPTSPMNSFPIDRQPPVLQNNDYSDHRSGQAYAPAPSGPTFGRSFLGLVAATIVGALCAAVWLTIMIAFQVEIGIIAWAIGALIGLTAGSIAKNPSAIYCSLVAFIAGCSILASKLVMVAVMMIVSVGMDFFEQVQNMLLSNKYEHAYVDQQIADNQYQGEKLALAEAFNKGYFDDLNSQKFVLNGREIGDANGDSAAMGKPMLEFRREIRAALAISTKEQREAWIENARKRHPDWVVDPNHATAAKILLMNEPGKLDEDLTKQAAFEVSVSDYLLHSEDASDNYLTETPNEVVSLRSDTLKTIVLTKIRELDSQGLKDLLKQAAAKAPTFVPNETEFITIVDELLEKGELPPELRQHASLRVNSATGNDFSSELFINLGEPEFIEKELKLREIVNPIWLASSTEDHDRRLTASQNRHKGWSPDSTNPQLIASDKAKEELKEEVGDGSFVGTLKMVFHVSDLLWLFLGFVSAFGTARSRADRTT